MKTITKLGLVVLTMLFAKSIIDKAIPLPGETLEDYEITSVWEHYCIMDLNKLPQDATEEELNYFLDVFSETDGYQELYEVYGQ